MEGSSAIDYVTKLDEDGNPMRTDVVYLSNSETDQYRYLIIALTVLIDLFILIRYMKTLARLKVIRHIP